MPAPRNGRSSSYLPPESSVRSYITLGIVQQILFPTCWLFPCRCFREVLPGSQERTSGGIDLLGAWSGNIQTFFRPPNLASFHTNFPESLGNLRYFYLVK